MRALLLSLAVLSIVPALAAEKAPPVKSQVIHLKYATARDCEEILFPRPDSIRPGVSFSQPDVDPTRASFGLMPEGITSFAADPRTNTLRVSGTPRSVEQLARIIRLLDIPAQQLRLRAAVIQPTPETISRIRWDGSNDPEASAVLPRMQASELIRRAQRTVVSTAIVATNNRPARVFWPDRRGVLTVVPRVNGDGTVTLLMSIEPSADPAVPLRPLRRIDTDTGVLIRMASGEVVVVIYERKLPDEKR